MPSLNVTVRRYTNSTFLGLLVVAAVGVIIATNHPAKHAEKSGSTTATLRVVATMRSVTVSPSKTIFARCYGGQAAFRSTRTELGYPNAVCQIGSQGGSRWPIVITNGVPALVNIESTVATPADGGTPWKLCNAGNHGVSCKGPGGMPGYDQFELQNFSPNGLNAQGVRASGGCDVEFNSGSCLASSGQIQREGIRLIGPSRPDDHARTWHVTITWVPAPP